MQRAHDTCHAHAMADGIAEPARSSRPTTCVHAAAPSICTALLTSCMSSLCIDRLQLSHVLSACAGVTQQQHVHAATCHAISPPLVFLLMHPILELILVLTLLPACAALHSMVRNKARRMDADELDIPATRVCVSSGHVKANAVYMWRCGMGTTHDTLCLCVCVCLCLVCVRSVKELYRCDHTDEYG